MENGLELSFNTMKAFIESSSVKEFVRSYPVKLIQFREIASGI
jgi:hypothetical protein